MSELRDLIDEAKTSLQNLDSLLQTAKSLGQVQESNSALSRDEIQKYFEEILRIVEKLPDNLKLEESIQAKGEIMNLLLQMEKVRNEVEQSLGRVETVCRQNLIRLTNAVAALCHPTPIRTRQYGMPLDQSDLLGQGKTHFENKDYEACVKVIQALLEVDRDNPEAISILREVQRKCEDERLEKELETHIETLKKEALGQFEKGIFEECVGMFRFLCELEPKDQSLRECLEISQEKVQQMQAVSRGGGSTRLLLEEKTGQDQRVAFEKTAREATGFIIKRSTADSLIQNTSAVSVTYKGQRQLQPKTHAAGEGRNGSRELPKGDPVEEAQPVAREQEVKRDSKWASKSDRRKLVIVWLVSANLLLGGVLGICLLLGPTGIVTGTMEIQSVPDGASVLMDEALKGKTPLRLESVEAKDYTLRIEKQGYIPLTRELSIEKGQTARLYVQLERPKTQPTGSESKQNTTQTFFSHERQNVSPGEVEVPAKVKTPKRKLTGHLEKTNPIDAGLTERLQGLRRQISSAIHSRNFFPPSPANAMQLLKQLKELSPEDTFGQEGLDQIYRELTSSLKRQLQARDIENARTVARQLQTYFPERPESQSLQDTLKAEETKLLEAQEAWIQKVESGMAAGRYVTPPNENVLFYCNQALLTDPQNPKVLQLRKESISKAAAQADEWIRTGKFDGAREVYSILLQLSHNESRLPFMPQELKGKMDRLEFDAYPVIHDHTIGSCTGRLRMNGFVISFVPTGDSKDGFTQKLEEIVQAEPGDKLRIQFKNKTYRFQVNLMTSTEAKREKVNTIYQNLSRRMANAM